MSGWKKLAAASAGGAGLDVDEVFSTHLYTGNGSSQTITNGIDLSGEGGMVWVKNRDSNTIGGIGDTERGTYSLLAPSESLAPLTGTTANFMAFNSDGFQVGNGNFALVNGSGYDYASWTFRKAPKFFDIVTYTGNGTAGRTVSHSLGATPGAILIKCTSAAENWRMWHTSLATNESIMLNSTGPKTNTVNFLNNTSPTSTTVTLGNHKDCNANGDTYVMYLFAHNNGDGEFGPDGDQDIIKCGSYTGSGSSGLDVNFGFEPQFVLIKNASGSGFWTMFDSMRGMTSNGAASGNRFLQAQSSSQEYDYYTDYYAAGSFDVTSTGIKMTGNESVLNGGSQDYIYMAIRRGSLFPPESASEVFDIDTRYSQNSLPSWQSGFIADFALRKRTNGSDSYIYSRLQETKELAANSNSIDANTSNTNFDYMNGWGDVSSVSSVDYGWMWKRAPGYFDVVPYKGNGVFGRTLSHNLGVVPEMIWVKRRDSFGDWYVYHKDIDVNNDNQPWTDYVKLNSNAPVADGNIWADTAPTAAVFSVGNQSYMNQNNGRFVAYLFSTLAGISKVGGYSGDGTNNRVINCGFSSGARFVLIRNATSSGSWYFWDTARGMVAGNDSILELNTTSQADTSQDMVDSHSSGFTVSEGLYENVINASGVDYIFYAIA